MVLGHIGDDGPQDYVTWGRDTVALVVHIGTLYHVLTLMKLPEDTFSKYLLMRPSNTRLHIISH